MKERIREIRKHYQLNQSDFGERIGVKQSAVTAYEVGARIPSESVIMAICREFGINRDWLETGTGEMMAQTDEEQLDRIAQQYSTDPTFRAILEVYMQMSDQAREMFVEYVHQLSDALRKTPSPADLEAAANKLDQSDKIPG